MADIFGFDLQQKGAASNDIRNIMSEQLNELRIMRAETQKQSVEKEKQATQTNPFIMNPFYTEHHSNNIDSAMSMMKAQESIRNEFANAPLRSLGQFMNEDGYFSMRYGGDIINGRGYSSKDIDIASVQTQSRIVGGALNKTAGLFGLGANLAGGAAGTGLTSAIMGLGALSIPGIGVGVATGALAETLARDGMEEIKTYYDYKEKLTAGSDRFIAVGEGSRAYGGGFTKSEIKRASKFMTSLNSEFDLKDSEVSAFYDVASDNNLLKGSQDIESFEKMMTKLTEMSKKYAKVLGKSLTEVGEMMGELKNAGISTDGYATVFNALDGNSAMLGMTQEQYVTSIANRTASTTYGTTANANSVVKSIAINDALIGSVMNTMSNVRSSDPSFDMANYISNLGSEGLSSVLSSAVGKTAGVVDSTILMAAFDKKTGNVDPAKVKDLLSQLKNKDLTIQDISKLADKQGGKDFDYFAFQGATAEFNAENSALAIEASASSIISSAGMSMEEFLALKDTKKQASIFMERGWSFDEAYGAIATITSTNGNLESTGEGNVNAGRLTNKLDKLSESYWDRFNVFSNKEMKRLSGVSISGEIDYSKKKMGYRESREAMKFGYASLTSNLGEGEDADAARRLVENSIGSQIQDFGWSDDGTAFIGNIAGQIASRSGAGNSLNDALTTSANNMGLADVVKVLEGIKSGSTEYTTKDVESALSKIMQADSDSFLSEDANTGNNAMMSAVDKNTEAQLDVVRKITKKFEDTTEELVKMMDTYGKFGLGGL